MKGPFLVRGKRGIKMKRKSKRQITKKKNEFRYHNVIVINQFGKETKIRHPTYIFLEKGNIYIYVSITHSNDIENHMVIKLRKNPNPKDKCLSFWIVEIKRDTKDRFGRKQKDWKINIEDEKDIREEYKKR